MTLSALACLHATLLQYTADYELGEIVYCSRKPQPRELSWKSWLHDVDIADHVLRLIVEQPWPTPSVPSVPDNDDTTWSSR